MDNLIVKEIVIPIFAAFGYVLKLIVDRHFKKKKPFIKRVLPTLAELSDCLNDITAETDCDRAVILKCQNGGGIPKVGSELYSSVVLQSRKAGHNIKDLWDRQRLDPVYIRNLVELDNHVDGIMLFKVADFEGSTMHDVYTSSNVECSELGTLAGTKFAWFYISCNFSKSADVITSHERAIMNASINKIRYIMKKNLDIL